MSATLGIPDPSRLVEGRHPPEARLHKWEARKDLGVVSAWIEAGSKPGELVVDPFMGSGTAPLAAARLGRRALGIDLSPLALRIAEVVAAPPPPGAVEAAFARVEASLRGPSARVLAWSGGRSTFRGLYETHCPSCAAPAELAHAVWSVRIACGCGAVRPAHEYVTGSAIAGRGRGTARARICPGCGASPVRGGAAYRGEELFRRFVRCGACGLVEDGISEPDRTWAQRLEEVRERAEVWIPRGVPLRYPGGASFAQLRHSLRDRPVLDELFTGRNALALGLLAEAIDAAGATGAAFPRTPTEAEREPAVRALRLSLSSVVKAASRMPTVNTGGWKNKGTGLSSHLLGIFPMHLEQNVWEEFERHVRTRLLPGLAAARARPAVTPCAGLPTRPGELSLRRGDAAAILDELPAASVGFAFLDPPYGDAVQYAELALPQLAWLGRPLGADARRASLDAWLAAHVAAEVVENRAQGKDRSAFAAQLGRVLGALTRVLAPGRAAVITFNSPEERLVRTVIELAAGAGLAHAGTHHQPAFKASHKGAWHERSARGTLYLRFVR